MPTAKRPTEERDRNYWVWDERDEWMRRNGELVDDDDDEDDE